MPYKNLAIIGNQDVFLIRASLRFGAVEKAKVYYTVQVEKDGKARRLKLKPGGELIKKFEFPKKK